MASSADGSPAYSAYNSSLNWAHVSPGPSIIFFCIKSEGALIAVSKANRMISLSVSPYISFFLSMAFIHSFSSRGSPQRVLSLYLRVGTQIAYWPSSIWVSSITPVASEPTDPSLLMMFFFFCFFFTNTLHGEHSPRTNNTNGENRKSVLPELLTVSSLVSVLGRLYVQVPLQLPAWVLVWLSFLFLFSSLLPFPWYGSSRSNRRSRHQIYHPLRPVLDHSADYTSYGNSLPQPCPSPSNLSATAWEKTDQKFLPGKVTMHSPAPRCDSLNVRPMALSERKRGLLAAEDWTPKGYIYCRTKTKKNNNSDFCSR